MSFAAPIATSTAASATPGNQVPFKGIFRGVETTTVNFPVATIQGEWTGVATHLGRFTVENPHVVNLLTADGTGTFEFTAANRDIVTADEVGHATFPSPGVLLIVEHGTITGGTGRFAGATGSIDVTRVEDGATGVTFGSFSGRISAP